jgi:hypothetical protein
MRLDEGETATEAALEDEGIHHTQHYALRADQLDDGTYRYALENPDTGKTLAEGVDGNPDRAIRMFEDNLKASGLSADEVATLIKAIDHYEES